MSMRRPDQDDVSSDGNVTYGDAKANVLTKRNLGQLVAIIILTMFKYRIYMISYRDALG